MALQILRQPSLGAEIGESLGTGLGAGLQRLAEMQLSEMQKRKQAGRLREGGLPEVLAYLDPKVQASYLRDFGAAQQQAQQEQEQAALQNILSGALGGQPQQVEPQENILQALQQLQPAAQEALQPVQPVAQVKEVETRKPSSPGARAAQELQSFENQLNTLPLTATQKMRMREQVEKRFDRLTAQQEKIDAKTKDYYTKLTEAKEGAESGDIRLDRMEELIKEGNLPSPITASILETLAHAVPIPGTGKSIGIDLKGTLLSDEAQEFDKLSKDFLKDAKKFFGSRITQMEINQFLKTIPTLMQSDEGKLRVVRNMRLFNEVSKLKSKIGEDIIEKNNGYRPHNFKQLVEKEAKPEVDRIAKEFKTEVGFIKETLKEQKRRQDKRIEGFAQRQRLF